MQDILDLKVTSCLNQLNVNYRVFPCAPIYADTEGLIEQYGFAREQIVNCIIVVGKGQKYAACIVLATCKIDVNKMVCQLLGVKRATFASAEHIMQLTGMMLGGVTAFGLPELWPIYIDRRVMQVNEILLGGGNRSGKVLLHPRELRKLKNSIIVPELGVLRE